MQYSVINYKTIKNNEGALRIDAEYYQPEFFIDFKKGKWKPIGEVISQCQYGLSLAMNDDKKGHPMFKMDDIVDAFLVDETVRYADVKEEVFKNFKIQRNDVFFNRVNSIDFVGRTGIYKLDRDATFASYLIRLKVKPEGDVLADYLNIFLNSAYGLRQIKKYARRAVNQANVNAEELKQMMIALLPIEFQREIEKITNNAWQLTQGSKKLYEQAEELLLNELGFKNFEQKERNSYIVTFADVKGSNRMDAEYFQPRYEEIAEIVKKYKGGWVRLDDIAQTKRGSLISDRYYNKEDGAIYIRGADFSSGFLNTDKLIHINPDFKPVNETKVHTGDIVFTLIGTVGSTALVEESFSDAFISNNIGKIIVMKYNPAVLQILLHSFLGKMYFEKVQTQTAQPKISDKDIREFILPKLPSAQEKQIEGLYYESQRNKKLSKSLLEIAKRGVEMAIEKDEKIAEEWLRRELEKLQVKL